MFPDVLRVGGAFWPKLRNHPLKPHPSLNLQSSQVRRKKWQWRGSPRLFLGYCYFPPKVLFKSGPTGPLVAAFTGGMPWFHLRCCGRGDGDREREREKGKKEAEGRREIEKLPLCHRAPTSARVTHLPADILPPCPGAAGKPRPANGGTGCRGNLSEETPKSGLPGRQMLRHRLRVLKDRAGAAGSPTYPLFTQPVEWGDFTWTH